MSLQPVAAARDAAELEPGGTDSLGRFGGPRRFLAEALSRNRGIVSDEEQALLQASRVLVAGCGSVGGAIVEPLVRLGVGALTLADPDVYDTHNLNRQACRLEDIGRPKPEVLAERVRAINPLVEVQTLTEGITVENAAGAVRPATVIFDGVDPAGESLWIKYLVHKHAAARRIPVLLGADIGGKPTVFVYDYRRDPRPLLGRGDESAFREGRELEAMRAMNRIQAVPADFFPVIERRAAEGGAWPQVAYTAVGLGALASRLVVDLALRRSVPRTVTADLHMATRTAPARAAARLRWPFAAARALRAVGRDASPTPPDPATAASRRQPAATAGLSEEVLTVGEAIRLAPSLLNEQPWRLRIAAANRLRLEIDPDRRLPAVDPDGRWLCMSIGCAVAAARRVADLELRLSDSVPGPLERAWSAGELEIRGLRTDGLMTSLGLLRGRRTDRRRYRSVAVPSELLAELQARAATHSFQLLVRTDRQSIWKASMVLCDAIGASLGDEAKLAELARWAQPEWRARDGHSDGIPASAFGVASPAPELLQLAARRPSLHGAMEATGLHWAIAGRRARRFRGCGTLLLLCGGETGPAAHVAAGEALMDVWLAATALGLAMEPDTTTIADPQTRDRIAATFELGPGADPFALIRLGYRAGMPAASPRLPLDGLFDPRD